MDREIRNMNKVEISMTTEYDLSVPLLEKLILYAIAQVWLARGIRVNIVDLNNSIFSD